ncbi:hypothetical protein HPY42_01950 [Coprothermobacteraceae bacterium]|nr:hypothetical protein [Coprothermobacteraceae bacterium]
MVHRDRGDLLRDLIMIKIGAVGGFVLGFALGGILVHLAHKKLMECTYLEDWEEELPEETCEEEKTKEEK